MIHTQHAHPPPPPPLPPKKPARLLAARQQQQHPSAADADAFDAIDRLHNNNNNNSFDIMHASITATTSDYSQAAAAPPPDADAVNCATTGDASLLLTDMFDSLQFSSSEPNLSFDIDLIKALSCSTTTAASSRKNPATRVQSQQQQQQPPPFSLARPSIPPTKPAKRHRVDCSTAPWKRDVTPMARPSHFKAAKAIFDRPSPSPTTTALATADVDAVAPAVNAVAPAVETSNSLNEIAGSRPVQKAEEKAEPPVQVHSQTSPVKAAKTLFDRAEEKAEPPAVQSQTSPVKAAKALFDRLQLQPLAVNPSLSFETKATVERRRPIEPNVPTTPVKAVRRLFDATSSQPVKVDPVTPIRAEKKSDSMEGTAAEAAAAAESKISSVRAARAIFESCASPTKAPKQQPDLVDGEKKPEATLATNDSDESTLSTDIPVKAIFDNAASVPPVTREPVAAVIQPPDSTVSVSKLREIWEQVARENGWTGNGGKKWLTAVRERGPREHRHHPATSVVAAEPAEDITRDAEEEGLSNAAPTLDVVPVNGNKVESRPFPIVPKAVRPAPSKNCDMIVCEVRTRSVDGHKVHEIDLRCEHCDSSFVLTAVHECDEDETSSDQITEEDPDNDDEELNLSVVPHSARSSPTRRDRRGLEWLQDGAVDCINIIV